MTLVIAVSFPLQGKYKVFSVGSRQEVEFRRHEQVRIYNLKIDQSKKIYISYNIFLLLGRASSSYLILYNTRIVRVVSLLPCGFFPGAAREKKRFEKS